MQETCSYLRKMDFRLNCANTVYIYLAEILQEIPGFKIQPYSKKKDEGFKLFPKIARKYNEYFLKEYVQRVSALWKTRVQNQLTNKNTKTQDFELIWLN